MSDIKIQPQQVTMSPSPDLAAKNLSTKAPVYAKQDKVVPAAATTTPDASTTKLAGKSTRSNVPFFRYDEKTKMPVTLMVDKERQEVEEIPPAVYREFVAERRQELEERLTPQVAITA